MILLGGIPKPKPHISLETAVAYGKDVTLKCSAIGYVGLTWYKKKRNGTRNDWELINTKDSTINTNIRNAKKETVRFLVIENFNVSDNGVYICDLYRRSVNWRARDEKYVGIKGM